MLRRHFMTGVELPDFIITYHAPEHIPFWCGMKKKDINSILNYGGADLEDDTDGFKTPIIFDIVLDKWLDGVGEWGVKIKNTTPISYYSTIQEGSYDNLESVKTGTADYYADYFNTNSNYVNKITNIIFPEGLIHINGSPIYNTNKNTSCLNITLPDSIEYLTGCLFGNYDSLKSITIPSNVKRIDNLCYVCSGNGGWSNLSLEEVILKPVTPPDASHSQYDDPLGTYYEDKVYNNLKIKVYADCIDTYKNDAVWGQYSDLYDTINNIICYTTKSGNNIYVSPIYFPNSTQILQNDRWLLCTQEAVVNLNSRAFRNKSDLNTIALPNSIISIEEYAFDGSGLNSIRLGNNLKTIGQYCFRGCSLNEIVIPSSVTTIGKGAFIWCDLLSSITVDDNNLIYDSRNNCNAIIETATNTLILGCDSTIIPNSVTSIESSAFTSCKNLTSITIPNSVTSIVDMAFNSCNLLTSVSINSDAIISKDYPSNASLFNIFGTQVTEYIIGDDVNGIGSYAFYNCSSLTSITIPNSVTSIGTSAFSGCKALTSVTLNSDEIVNKNYAEIYNLGTIFGSQVTEYIIGDKVKGIGSYAFANCSSLSSINIPNSITSIGDLAFSYCSSLTSINIPESVVWIGDRTFEYCSSLTSVSIPNNITGIGNNAFQYCSSLTSVVIPDSITSIGYEAFYNCSSLTSITFNGTKDQWEKLTLGIRWNIAVPATVVHCTDGDVAL